MRVTSKFVLCTIAGNLFLSGSAAAQSTQDDFWNGGSQSQVETAIDAAEERAKAAQREVRRRESERRKEARERSERQARQEEQRQQRLRAERARQARMNPPSTPSIVQFANQLDANRRSAARAGVPAGTSIPSRTRNDPLQRARTRAAMTKRREGESKLRIIARSDGSREAAAESARASRQQAIDDARGQREARAKRATQERDRERAIEARKQRYRECKAANPDFYGSSSSSSNGRSDSAKAVREGGPCG